MSEKLFRFHEVQRLLGLLGKLALGGVLAFGLGFSEFLLVSRTSSLALSISGIFKVLAVPPVRAALALGQGFLGALRPLWWEAQGPEGLLLPLRR